MVFKLTPGLVVETWLRVTSAATTGAPLSRSLPRTSGTATPPVLPLTGVPVSSTALIGAAPTCTATSASEQLVGSAISQIR